MSFYLESCVWPDEISRLIQQQIQKKCDGDSGNDQTSVRGRKLEPEFLNGMLGSGQNKKGETGKEQSKKHAHHFV
jgi:hypothetical protein